MDERRIRVWLETSYDHGRTGAWLLDWPGAFTWGRDRAAALARATSAAHRFVDWLADHGESVARPQVGEPVVVEQVEAYRLDDGYEVNATFAADAPPLSGDELEASIRWLGYARDDLTALLHRLADYEASGGRLALEDRSAEALASGASAGRAGEEVLRHLAGAEAWMSSRLDASARYEGPARDGDPEAYLEATRAFLVDTLRAIWAHDPGATRTDSKGEIWTLAKLLRRSLYHSLDHLDELDRRLAIATRRVDGLDLRPNTALDPDVLRALFASAGLERRALDDRGTMERMLAGSTETVSAWDGERLVGFARLISDEATNGYISTVTVSPRWQDRGLGTRLMRALLDGRDNLKLTLDAREGSEPFYERLGFQPVSTVLVRPRSRPT